MVEPKATQPIRSMSAKETSTRPPSKVQEGRHQPSVTVSVFVCWIVPVILIAALTRFAVDTGPAFLPPASKPVTLDLDATKTSSSTPLPTTTQGPTKSPRKAPSESQAQAPTVLDKPSSYQEVVKAIGRRRLDWTSTSSDAVKEYAHRQEMPSSPKSVAPAVSKTPSGTQSTQQDQQVQQTTQTHAHRGASSDPVRTQLLEKIDDLRKDYRAQPDNIFKAVALADALRLYDVQYHDGGTSQVEAIETYQRAIRMGWEKRQEMIRQGEETNRSLTGTADVNEEMAMDYSARSMDGLLCALHTALGKTYFMANMFEKAAESYSEALEIEPFYLDAMSARGSTRIILGQFEEAAQDYMTVMEKDSKRRYQDIYTGLARVLQARESAVPEGWAPMIQNLEEMIPLLESQLGLVEHPEGKTMLSNTLNRFYHVLFLYHDVKTKDTDAAWENLSKSYYYKMGALPKWSDGFESQKISATKQIFRRGFWPEGVGSQTEVPVFIIGFVRSGSTLLERVLDAHPQIVGTGENSVFNGQLDHIRNKIVETSMLGDANELTNVIKSLADDVVDEMRNRWKMVAAGENRAADREEPRRYADKMLTNYYNVGFIHMLFPNALILHVLREPMDSIFSAYKHEFPSGPLDYTSHFPSLSELYHGYRDLIEHWDKELPGRVTHIRYEDMVHDMPGVARKIIQATGLEWDDGVLDFHKKKHAVNTLSTTQVRKGVYKDSLQAWRRYENHLKPLVDMIGERTTFNLRTTLAGYEPPMVSDIGGQEEASANSDGEGPVSQGQDSIGEI